jgi:hypothetical protein
MAKEFDYLAEAQAAGKRVFGVESSRTDEEKMADESLSIQLLAGFDVDTGNLISLAHNSAAELKARAALARIIREKMNGFSGELLALAIDPHTKSARHGWRPARKIKFEKPGRKSTMLREKQIIDYIRRMRFDSTEPRDMKYYLNSAAHKFGLKYSRVHSVWSEYEKMLKQVASKK